MPTQASTGELNGSSNHDGSKSRDPDRVRRLTFKRDQDRIDERTRDALRASSNEGHAAITRRLEELDREWPVDRALMTGAGCFVWLGLILGSAVRRRLYIMSAVAGGMLLAYALFGWAPPVLILRRLGFHTRGEINQERTALKALRGDFENLPGEFSDQGSSVERAMRAAEI